MTSWTTITPSASLREELGLPDMPLPVRAETLAVFESGRIDLALLADDIDRFTTERPEAAASLAEVGAFISHLAAVDAGRAGDHESALFLADLGIRHRPRNLSLAADRALALMGLGRLDEARAELEGIIADPRVVTAPGVWLLAARAAAAQGDHGRAATLLRELAVDALPPDEEFWDLLAAESTMAGPTPSAVPGDEPRRPRSTPPPAAPAMAVEAATSPLARQLMIVGAVLAVAAIGFGILRSDGEGAVLADDTGVTTTSRAVTTTAPTTTTTAPPTTTTAPTTTTTTTTTAPTTTTTAPPTTTTAPTTTTTSTTTTTTTTTTTLPPTTTTVPPTTTTVPGVLTVGFTPDSPAPTPVFSDALQQWSVTPAEFGRLQANVAGILPVVFDPEFGDLTMTFLMASQQLTIPEARIGAVVRTDDASDGVLSRYVFVAFSTIEQTLLVGVFTDSEFTTVQSIPLPVFLDAAVFSEVRITVIGTTVTVFLNDAQVVSWTDANILPAGRVGFVVFGSEGGGEVLLVDDLDVRAP